MFLYRSQTSHNHWTKKQAYGPVKCKLPSGKAQNCPWEVMYKITVSIIVFLFARIGKSKKDEAVDVQ